MLLLKQIKNEKRSNGWLCVELCIVFMVLWYVVDWMYVTARTYYEPMGLDITDTYYLEMGVKDSKSQSFILKDQLDVSYGEDFVDRLRRLPEVEAVSLSYFSRPYFGGNSASDVRIGSLDRCILKRQVTPDFFRVFRYESADGGGYEPLMHALEADQVVVSENILSSEEEKKMSLLGQNLVEWADTTHAKRIGALAKKVRYSDYYPIFRDMFMAVRLDEKKVLAEDMDAWLGTMEVCVRVKPGTGADFPERLMKLSGSQLAVGNLFIVKVHDYEQIRDDFQRSFSNKVQMHVWMMVFLLMNIFLGIIGTFWFRTQHRRSELALHLVLGSTRRQLWGRLHQEGLWLLTLSAVPAWVVCYLMGEMDLVVSSFTVEWSWARFLITLVITYLLMALLIAFGISFPARQAMRIQPAQALREE